MAPVNNVTSFSPGGDTARQAKRFQAATSALRRRGVCSPRIARALVVAVVLALAAGVAYSSYVLYAKQAAAVAKAAEAPAMGQVRSVAQRAWHSLAPSTRRMRPRRAQWAMVKDEEVVVETARERGLRGDDKVVTTVVPRRARRIVLSTGEGRWNTGVWPNWGQGTDEVTLNWAAAGVRVKKSCSVKCEITHDQSGIDAADAVVMETINHPQFLGPAADAIPLPWPALRDNLKRKLQPAPTTIPATLPLTAIFYYEAAGARYSRYTLANAELAAKFDFSMTPSQDSTLPVTLVCPWGRATEDFLAPPAAVLPRKAPGRLVAYFNEHGVAPAASAFVDELFALAGKGIHAYQNRRNADVPPEFGAIGA